MFTEKMIAPCGLDCSLCSQSHKKEKPCEGCRGSDENKPEFCSARCKIILCEVRREKGFRFCDECPSFPCAFCSEKENRYQTQYVLKESPFSNLKSIREKGMAFFLERQKQRWSCGCGGVISVHDGICSSCGKRYERSESAPFSEK